LPKLKHILPAIIGLSILTSVSALAGTGTAATQTDATTQSVALFNSKHLARSVTKIEINAPQSCVWGVLTDFSNYPDVFARIQSCKVTKKQGNLVYTEALLKPHMFLSEACQHTINDLAGAPSLLTWQTTDGNFKALGGKWEIKPSQDGEKCTAIYTLQVDPGGLVPAPLVGVMLHSMQKEIVASVKKSAETEFQDQRTQKTSKLPQSKPLRGNG
jgi:ribosome-associated toxin RatA of RatAB toxin-antitoxin module